MSREGLTYMFVQVLQYATLAYVDVGIRCH